MGCGSSNISSVLKSFHCYLHLSNGEGNGNPLQYSCLANPMDGGSWWAAVHGVARSQTRLSDFTFTLHFHAMEKEMATHSSVLAWRIPGTGEPSGLPSMGSHRVGHDWSDSSSSNNVCTTYWLAWDLCSDLLIQFWKFWSCWIGSNLHVHSWSWAQVFIKELYEISFLNSLLSIISPEFSHRLTLVFPPSRVLSL